MKNGKAHKYKAPLGYFSYCMAGVLLLYLGDYSNDLHAKSAVVLQEMFFEDMGERK